MFLKYMGGNTIYFLKEVVDRLEGADLSCLVVGGWAEEINQMIQPRSHGDVDLLFLDVDLQRVDNLIELDKDFDEIHPKRFHHKRAFYFRGIMVELILVQGMENNKPYTRFWNEGAIEWPPISVRNIDVPGVGTLPVAEPSLLHFYRSQNDRIDQMRRRHISAQ